VLARRGKGANVADVTVKYDGPTVNNAFKEDDDIISYLDIDGVDIDDGLTYVSELHYKDRPSRAKYVLKECDILISNVRPERGAITLITSRDDGVLASSGFSLLRRKPGAKLRLEYIFAVLRSSFVRKQLLRRNHGSMYPAVTFQDVADLWVPFPPESLEQSVAALVKAGLSNHDHFTQLHKDLSERLTGCLSAYIGKPPPSPIEPITLDSSVSIRNSGEFFSLNGPQRFDAEFFRGDYSQYQNHLQEAGDSFLLGDFYEGSNGRSPGKPVEEVAYLRQSVLTNIGINWSALTMERGSIDPPRGRVKFGDILLACTAHEIFYVGRKVDYVREVPEHIADNNVCVADILIFRPKPEKPATITESYVAAFLRSPWGLHQARILQMTRRFRRPAPRFRYSHQQLIVD